MHFLVLAGASLAGVVAVVVLVTRRGRRRRAARLVLAAAVALYVWGMLLVLGAVLEAEDGGTSSAPAGPCREAGSGVVGYDVSYGWLGFDCRLSDGGTYTTSVVPGYVNVATVLLGVTALVLAYRTKGEGPGR